MKYHPFRRVVGRFHPRPAPRYADLTADCREELALIADHHRSEPMGHFTL